MPRANALAIVNEFIKEPGLKRHMFAVEAAMHYYAMKLDGDVDAWGIAGLLHDFDWEIHPTLADHPAKGVTILRERNIPEDICHAILAHNSEYTNTSRETPMDFALLACDEITGLIIATALVRQSKNILDVKLKSIKKKWRDKGFAAGVDRDHIESATADFSRACCDGKLELWDHVENVLEAMQDCADALDLGGQLAHA